MIETFWKTDFIPSEPVALFNMHGHQNKLEWKNQQILSLMSPQDSSGAITGMGQTVGVSQHTHTGKSMQWKQKLGDLEIQRRLWKKNNLVC